MHVSVYCDLLSLAKVVNFGLRNSSHFRLLCLIGVCLFEWNDGCIFLSVSGCECVVEGLWAAFLC